MALEFFENLSHFGRSFYISAKALPPSPTPMHCQVSGFLLHSPLSGKGMPLDADYPGF